MKEFLRILVVNRKKTIDCSRLSFQEKYISDPIPLIIHFSPIIPQYLSSISKFQKYLQANLFNNNGVNHLRKIKKYASWTIYEAFSKNENNGYRYAAFLPDDGPDVMGSPEWQADNLQEIIDFINSY